MAADRFGWSKLKRLCAWAMFLVSMCICARASDLTEHCPELERVRLPPERHWDVDGLPKYIIVVMLNWKNRGGKKRINVGKPYPMKIHRNYLDPIFCPVTWVLIYLKYAGHTTGPLFALPKDDTMAGLSDPQWKGMLAHWFLKAGLRTRAIPASEEDGQPRIPPKGCSSHSIRRSAAQWASRCGAREMDVRNAGRWRSMLILAKYLAQGAMQREAYEDDEEGPQEDPIFKVFVFKKVTSAAASGLDIM